MLGGSLVRRNGEQRGDGVAAADGADIGHHQLPTIKADVIDLNIVGLGTVKAPADAEFLRCLNGSVEAVGFNVLFLQFAIDINLGAGSFAFAVVGDKYMRPLFGWHLGLADHLDGVVLPFGNDVGADSALL